MNNSTLTLNHFRTPILGFLVIAVLFLFGLHKSDPDLGQIALGIFSAVLLFSLPSLLGAGPLELSSEDRGAIGGTGQ